MMLVVHCVLAIAEIQLRRQRYLIFELHQFLTLFSLLSDQLQDARMAVVAVIPRSTIIQSNRDSKLPIECAETDRNNKLQYLEISFWNLSHVTEHTVDHRVPEALHFDSTLCMTIRQLALAELG